jgi:hypothetical protein
MEQFFYSLIDQNGIYEHRPANARSRQTGLLTRTIPHRLKACDTQRDQYDQQAPHIQPAILQPPYSSLQATYRDIPSSSDDCDVHEFNLLKAQVHDSLGRFHNLAAA